MDTGTQPAEVMCGSPQVDEFKLALGKEKDYFLVCEVQASTCVLQKQLQEVIVLRHGVVAQRPHILPCGSVASMASALFT